MGKLIRRKTSSAGMPTVRMTADSPTYSLADERRWMRKQRVVMALIVAGLIVGAIALAFSWNQFTRRPAPVADAPRQVAAENVAAPAAPSAPANPQGLAAPSTPAVAQPAAPSAPAVAQPAAPVVAAPAVATATCPAIAGLPIFEGARCVEHETDLDDGVLETRNTFVADAPPDTVRQFFETALAQNGWTLVKTSHDVEDLSWDYTATQGIHRLKLEIDGQPGPNGNFARIKIDHQ